MALSLYDLTESELVVLDLLEDENLTDEQAKEILRDNLTGTKEAIAGKLLAYAQMIRNKKAEAEMCKNEAQRLSAKAKAAENRVRWMNDAIEFYFDATDQVCAFVGPFKIKLQDNGGKQPLVVEKDAKDLPPVFQKIEPDNEAIRKALEDGEDVEGCYLAPRGKHVRVY
jgi:hypothetical protein